MFNNYLHCLLFFLTPPKSLKKTDNLDILGRPVPGLLHVGKPPATNPTSETPPLSSPRKQKQPSPANSSISEGDEVSPEVPPRPQNPSHPKNSSSRPGAWNLPSENSFRAGGVVNSPTNNFQPESQSPLEAPDLCKDVRNSLERSQSSSAKNSLKRQQNENGESRIAQV